MQVLLVVLVACRWPRSFVSEIVKKKRKNRIALGNVVRRKMPSPEEANGT
jgi:hypothetical protein